MAEETSTEEMEETVTEEMEVTVTEEMEVTKKKSKKPKKNDLEKKSESEVREMQRLATSQKHLGAITNDKKSNYIVKHAILENKKLFLPGSGYSGKNIEKYLAKGQIRKRDK